MGFSRAGGSGGEAELGGFLGGALHPALRDGLAADVEAHDAGAVGVQSAEQRVFPTAEAVEGDRDRQRDIDADHADLDSVAFAKRKKAVRRGPFGPERNGRAGYT